MWGGASEAEISSSAKSKSYARAEDSYDYLFRGGTVAALDTTILWWRFACKPGIEPFGLNSLHAKRLEHAIGRVRVETGLEFGKQFSGDCGDVTHAHHREEDAAGT